MYTISINIAKCILVHIAVIKSANSHDTIIIYSTQLRYDFQTKFENQTFSLHFNTLCSFDTFFSASEYI